MKIKKFVLVILVLLASFSLHAQAKDVVLVVDTCASMFSYYNEVNTYLTGPFLAENIRMGDTLHIISFGGKPRFEIVRRIVDQGDIETVSGRIWLLYPLDPNSDAGSSINYAEQYARNIPGSRPKQVFIVSDDDDTGNLTAAAAGRLKPNGIAVTFIKASKQMPSSGRRAATPPATTPRPAGTPGPAGTPATTTPGNTGTPSPAGTPAAAQTTTPDVTTTPGTATTPAATGTTEPAVGQTGNDTGTSADTGTPAANDGITSTDAAASPDNSTTTTDTTPGTTNTGSNTRQDDTGTSRGNTAEPFSFSKIPLPLIFAGLLLLLLIIIIIIAVTRRLHNSPKEAVASARTDSTAAKNAELLNSFASRQAEAALHGIPRRYQYKDPGRFLTNPPMLNLFVEEQNTAIGRRNVHALKKGSSYTVGGGNSDFLIFLVPVPARLGLLYFDGNNCTFTPLKPKYFPDIGSTPVPECIGKTIRILSDKNYEVFFHFERYKDPLIALNQLLNSIQVPEPPEPWKKQ